jgi:phosphate uptake regulator/aminoglycoside phosphotransferase (APT) family kinase protein
MSRGVLDDLAQDLAMMARVVQSQLAGALEAFAHKDRDLAAKVRDKDDQVDNLLGFLEERCFLSIGHDVEPTSPRARQIRGVFRVALNLEKVGDYAVNIAEQAMYASCFPAAPAPFDLGKPAAMAMAGLDEVIAAFVEGSSDRAKRACACEPQLDAQYRAALAETFARLRRPGEDPAFVITHLFVAKFLERLGDSILNIGETTLFILTGERLKLHQYLHLEEMRSALAAQPDTGALDFRQIWGGISGARVGRLSLGSGRAFIWKEGAEQKIEEELREMAAWNHVVPGLVPDVRARHQEGGRESFLGDYLDGVLLRDVYLTRPWMEKVRVTHRLLETVRDIWIATSSREVPSAAASYVAQIRARLPELYGTHPSLASLRREETRVFGITHRSLRDLLARVADREPRLAPPVTVRIHGDFNTNNVIYNPAADRVHFIDVHRSGAGDYCQDIGVFLVSLIRTPLHDRALLGEFGRLDELVVQFAEAYAALIGDEHFRARLTLARARSLVTSARLVTDVEFARELYLKGIRLLETVAGSAP